MSNHNFPILRVAQIVDRYNVVLTGDLVSNLRVGESLTIVAVGQLVAGTRLPLVMPKAELIVSLVTEAYAIAGTESTTTETEVEIAESRTLGELLGMPRTQKEKRRVVTRDKLAVKEEQMTGNPAARPIVVDDFVVRSRDVAVFASWLGSQTSD